MKREFSAYLVTVFIVAFLVGSMSIGTGNSFIGSSAEVNDFIISDGEGSSIYITDNSNFTLYAGSGIAGDPYIIAGEVLTNTGDGSVYIQDTDVYVVITDCVMNGTGYYGVYLNNVSNLNITSCDIYDKSAAILIDGCSRIFVSETNITNYGENDYGIRIDVSDNISVRNCNISLTSDGIQLWNSYRVEIVDNVFTGTGITFYGTCQVSTGIRIQNNIVNDKPLGYLYNAHDRVIDISGYGQALLINSVNVTLYNGDISDVNSGVEFIFCQNSVLAYSNVTGCKRGVLLYESAYSKIYGNNLTGNTHGIMGYFATGSIIHENNVLNNIGYGIWMWYGCSSSAVYLNNFIDNVLGNARDDGGIEDSNLIWLGARFRNPISNHPLINVSVTIEKDGRSYTGHTNENGLFKVPLPALGVYNFTVEKFRYQTKYYINHVIDQYGIHLYDIGLDKADLGSGTGYVLARFMDGATPIVGVDIQVYSVLDGAYYFHSSYVSADVPYAGWVNITGLYYDDYVFVITHPDYERNIINQVIIANGHAGTYNNIQLTAYSTDAFIYGNVTDEMTGIPLENVNITIYNEIRDTITVFTDNTGLYNVTDIPFGTYQAMCSLIDYQTVYFEFNINENGSQGFNPFDFEMLHDDYVPSEPGGAEVNGWDNGVKGNYWDDFGGVVLLADEEGVYEVPGNNTDNPIDEHPLDEIVDIQLESISEPDLDLWVDSLEIYESETPDDRVSVNSFGVVRWKVSWASNGTEIIENLDMLIQVNGPGIDNLLLAEYIDGWWTVSYNHTDVAILEFSVYSVVSYGMTDFVQLVENIEIIWDRIVVVSVTTNTNITIIPTDIEGIESGVILIILGMSIVAFVAVILYIIKKKSV
jgi:parallel beta-helix repeat protein